MVAFHAGVGKSRSPGAIAAVLFREGVIEEEAALPRHDRRDGPPGGYPGAHGRLLRGVRGSPCRRTWIGRKVVVLAEGDPLFYGSYMYLHDRLSPASRPRWSRGATFAAATAAVASRLCGRPTC